MQVLGYILFGVLRQAQHDCHWATYVADGG